MRTIGGLGERENSCRDPSASGFDRQLIPLRLHPGECAPQPLSHSVAVADALPAGVIPNWCRQIGWTQNPLGLKLRTHLVNTTRNRDASLVIALVVAGFTRFFPSIAWLLSS